MVLCCDFPSTTAIAQMTASARTIVPDFFGVGHNHLSTDSAPSNRRQPVLRLGHHLRRHSPPIVLWWEEAKDWLMHWSATTPPSELAAMHWKPSSMFCVLLRRLLWTAELLTCYSPVDLLQPPDRFLADVIPLTAGKVSLLRGMGKWRGCAFLLESMRAAVEVKLVLGGLLKQRREIARANVPLVGDDPDVEMDMDYA